VCPLAEVAVCTIVFLILTALALISILSVILFVAILVIVPIIIAFDLPLVGLSGKGGLPDGVMSACFVVDLEDHLTYGEVSILTDVVASVFREFGIRIFDRE